MKDQQLQDLELDLLLLAVHHRYGHDFQDYSRASLKRRVVSLMNKMGIEHVSQLIPLVLRDEMIFNDFLIEMSITVTEMFRDPSFYAAVRAHVIPYLSTYPHIKIWHAGCSTGEEAYSMAILLKEEGIYARSHIYATDFNNESLEKAREGIYPLAKMKQFLLNYNHTGAKGSFSDYYHAKYGRAKIFDTLKENITFTNHNLVMDNVFGEMNLIVCRNVLIYFNKKLQNKVLKLFRDSLCHRGFLCLGAKESLQFSEVCPEFEEIERKERIFRKQTLVQGHDHV